MCAETIRIPLLVCSYSRLPQGGAIIIGKTGMIMDMAVGGWFVMPNNVRVSTWVHERAYVSGTGDNKCACETFVFSLHTPAVSKLFIKTKQQTRQHNNKNKDAGEIHPGSGLVSLSLFCSPESFFFFSLLSINTGHKEASALRTLQSQLQVNIRIGSLCIVTQHFTSWKQHLQSISSWKDDSLCAQGSGGRLVPSHLHPLPAPQSVLYAPGGKVFAHFSLF